MGKLPRLAEMECFLCGAGGAGLCDECEIVAVCPAHRPAHRPASTCLPFTRVLLPGRGHCLVATRDLLPGELVLSELPAITAPYTRSRPVCLQCYALLSPASPRCRGCGFPGCSPACLAGPRHAPECRLMAGAEFEAEVEEWTGEPDPHYAAILPLRCLLLQQTNPSTWRQFAALHHHCDKLRDSQVAATNIATLNNKP